MEKMGYQLTRTWLPILFALMTLSLVYGGTLQRDVNGSSHDYMLDVGETQVALNLWGTLHFTGYPLFTILSAALTHCLRLTGLTPAGAASATCTLWSLLGLTGVYFIIIQLTGGAHDLAALGVLLLGLVESFWIHSVVAEVYSFSLCLTSATLLAAMQTAAHWDEHTWLLTMFLLGTSVQHHRVLCLLMPTVLLITAPALWRRRDRWPELGVKSVLCFIAPFLAYVYLPLRAAQGALWVYGRLNTWDGFWTEFTGRGVTSTLVRWPATPAVWLQNIRFLTDHLQRQLPIPVLLAGSGGLIWLMQRRTFWQGVAFLVGAGAFMAFVVAFPRAVWAPAVLMPGMVFLIVGLIYLLQRVIQSLPVFRPAAWIGAILTAMWLFRINLPFVHALTTDPLGRQVIATLRPLAQAQLPGGRNVVELPWGQTYCAAAYGLYVTHELTGFELVDHSRNFQAIVRREGKILTLDYTLGLQSLEWWGRRLGKVYLSSAAPGVAMISADVLYRDTPARTDFELGNGVRVRAADLAWTDGDTLRLTLYWEATQVITTNYQVAVHLVSHDPPVEAGHILAQADALNPVGGWYPTSLWTAGEIVRDDYILTVPPSSHPVAVRVAMYQRSEDGGFINTHWLSLPIP